MPPNVSTVYDRYGKTYNLSRILNAQDRLDPIKYQAYSPPYISAGYYLYLCVSFTAYTFAFVYVFLNEWKIFQEAIKGLWKGLRDRKSSAYARYRDPLSILMRNYEEVPDWWFLILLVISVVVGCVIVHVYPTGTPVWAAIVAILVGIAMLVPCIVLYSNTGYFLSLNNLGTILAGYMVPGSGVACLILRAYGYAVEDQAETFISDQKLAHYAKLPPRAVFRAQLIATIISIFVTSGALELAHGLPDFCSLDQGSRFYCAWSHSIYSGTLLFGAVGPHRTFDLLYPMIKWAFLIGGVAAVPIYFVRQRFAKQLRFFHPALVLGGFMRYGTGYNLSYYTPGFYASVAFMWYIRTRYLAWWSKYNYIISCGLTAGIAFSGILIFLALQYRPKTLVWWGNTVATSGVDGINKATLKPLPNVGYFGVANNTWV
ncbi:OPT oligopeptide transporter protein-domain-containing protein [Lipomyces japonicus]|uniref:OPT oligopeptide transporter protein-domain-containing protein n=1 Tax=Lipomyces japonicus TaxID=56871 RepID=UPI0034CFB749